MGLSYFTLVMSGLTMINPIKLPMNKTRVLSPQLLPIRGDSSPSGSNMGWSSGEDKSMAWTQKRRSCCYPLVNIPKTMRV